MEKILTALGLNTRLTVGISVSSSNIIEITVMDKNADTILKYAAKEIKYNNSIRELVNYDEFSMAVIELFEEINVNPGMCNIVLSLPNVYFGFGSVPLTVPEEQVAGAVVSDVEQMYLFKRHEPVISWNTISLNTEAAKRYIVYGALQETIIRNIVDVFEDIGAKLVALETSNAALIQGIICSGLIEDEMINGSSVNVILISPNSYSLFCMYGDKLVDYYEEPVAVKSLSADEVYDAIAASISNTMAAHPAESLLVISEINEVSAEILSSKIRFDGTLKYVERNIYGDKAFMPVSTNVLPKYHPVISLASVGVASYTFFDYPIKFNFLEQPEEKVSKAVTLSFWGSDYEILRKDILKTGGIVLLAIAGLSVVLYFSLFLLNNKIDKKNSKLKDEVQELINDIRKEEANQAGVLDTFQKFYKNNKAATNVYAALSDLIPDDIYLTYFSANSDGELSIKGKAPSLEDAKEFANSLNERVPGFTAGIPEITNTDENAESSSQYISFEIKSRYSAQNGKSQQFGNLEHELTERNLSPQRNSGVQYNVGTTTAAPAQTRVPSAPPKVPEIEIEETNINETNLPSVDKLPRSEVESEDLPEPAIPN